MYTPLASLSDREISSIKNKISEKIINFDYCKYKPQNQKFDTEKIKDIYYKFTIETFSKELASLIEEINLN